MWLDCTFCTSSKMANANRMACLVLLHIFLSFVLTQSALKGSLVKQVPGFQGNLPSKHYAGYSNNLETNSTLLSYFIYLFLCFQWHTTIQELCYHTISNYQYTSTVIERVYKQILVFLFLLCFCSYLLFHKYRHIN